MACATFLSLLFKVKSKTLRSKKIETTKCDVENLIFPALSIFMIERHAIVECPFDYLNYCFSIAIRCSEGSSKQIRQLDGELSIDIFFFFFRFPRD